ncbi:MAG TPA: MarR family transcriptional regulator [Nocardioides sp.]
MGADELADALLTASRALVGIAVRSINAAPVEVTLVQHRLLVLLATGGDQTIGALAAQLEVNASNASRLCDRLERLGLISRIRSVSDGRAVDVSLTAEGSRLLETVRERRRRDVGRVLSGLSLRDAEAAVAALTAFNEAAHEQGETQWNSYLV